MLTNFIVILPEKLLVVKLMRWICFYFRLPGKLVNESENLLTDSTEVGTLDDFIDLSKPTTAVLPNDGFIESVNGQTLTPSPNGIPLVAFEDDSNIQFKPLSG